MPAELAHQKADKHLCVAFHRKVRIRYILLADRSAVSIISSTIYAFISKSVHYANCL